MRQMRARAEEPIRWLNRREARAWRSLQLMQLQLDGRLGRQLTRDSGLSYAEYVVLVGLTESPEGRLRQFELADVLGWDQSRLSHQISRMCKRGLVEKQKCDADRRGAFVVVTERGRDEIEAAAPGHVAAVRSLFVDHLTPAQLDVIAEASEAVLAGIAALDTQAGREP